MHLSKLVFPKVYIYNFFSPTKYAMNLAIGNTKNVYQV